MIFALVLNGKLVRCNCLHQRDDAKELGASDAFQASSEEEYAVQEAKWVEQHRADSC